MKNKSGFTLIELLVVISIISLLSSIVMASISSARIRARDTAIREEMRQVQVALELYELDHGRYPSTEGCNYSSPGLPCSDSGDFAGQTGVWGQVGINSLVGLLSGLGYISGDVLKDFQNLAWFHNGYESRGNSSIYTCVHRPYFRLDITPEIINAVHNKGYTFAIRLPLDHQFDVIKSNITNIANSMAQYNGPTYKDPFVGLVRISHDRGFRANTLCASNLYLGRN